MNTPSLVTAAADRRAALPADLDQRLDHISRARASLASETRRLERIGFEDPMRRCHEERRYWDFLAAVHGMAVPAEPVLGTDATVSPRGRFA